jgi:hypothetical protein
MARQGIERLKAHTEVLWRKSFPPCLYDNRKEMDLLLKGEGATQILNAYSGTMCER